MIRAVLFDFDGTLYDRDAAILRTAEEQFEMFREEFDVDKSTFLEKVVELDDHGHGRAPHFHHALGKALGFSADLAERLEACFRSRYPDHCRISGDSLNTLETLRAGGEKLGIITNGPTGWQSRKIECMGIARLFDTILISETEGIQKPDPRIFGRALERCGIPAGEAMFVGDHPAIDIEGAKGAGLTPVWKRMPYWEVPSDIRTIDQLSEILALLL